MLNIESKVKMLRRNYSLLHEMPSPENPLLQVQLNEPIVLLQVADE